MITLNPPPSSSKCHKCGKVRDLTKTFRTTMRGTDYEQVGASWECKKCINLEAEEQ